MMMGTPQYISPEQAKGTRDLDAGTDIYSMGVLLFEMVTGRVPFSADTPYSIIHDHIFTPLPLPTTINPDIPKEVERVLLKALAKERADRYSDVDSFVAAFTEAFQLDEIVPADHAAAVPVQAPTAIAATKPTPDPISSTGDAPHAKAKPAKKRKRVWLFAAAGALALLCLCLLVLLGPVRENAQKNATATAQAAVPLPPPVKEPALAQEIAAAEEQLAQNPKDAVAHINLAWLYLQAEKVDAAEEHMHQAVELHSTEEWIYNDVGRYLIETGRPELAAEAYIIGLQVLPASEPLRMGLLELFWQEQLLEKYPAQAEMYAQQLVEAAPEDPLFHLFLAQALVRNGKMDEGREELDSVLERHPDMAEAHFINGIWFRKNRQFIQARREFRLALELAGDRDWLQRAIQRELNNLEGEE
jgi:Tfp pilus assembly protein PilF